MRAGTPVVFIVKNKLKEGFIVKNGYNVVIVKTQRKKYRLKPYQIARKEAK